MLISTGTPMAASWAGNVIQSNTRFGSSCWLPTVCFPTSQCFDADAQFSVAKSKQTADKYAIKLSFHLFVLFFAVCRANATIDVSLQMQLGNPSNAGADTNNHAHYLIQRPVEAMDYSDNLREPNWTSWDLTASDVGSSGRSPVFFADTNLPSNFYVVASTDYSGSGYDRGHMCPSADRTDNVTDNDMVFFMSNFVPQTPDNNQGPWENLETYCRTLAQTNELLIICGPSGFGTNRTD